MPDRFLLSLKPPAKFAGWILLASLLAAGGTWEAIRRTQRERARERFELAMNEARDRLEQRLVQSEELIRGLRAMAQASGGMDGARFHAYFQGMNNGNRYAGLLGVSYLVPVPPAQRGRILDRLRAEQGRPGLQVVPGWGYPDDSLVVLVEPATTARALGFNPASSTIQVDSLRAARDSGRIQASPPMAVAQAPEAGLGLLLRLADYAAAQVPPTLQARRAAYRGCVNAVFLVSDLAAAALRRASEDGVRMRVSDAQASGGAFLDGGAERPARAWNVLAPSGFQSLRSIQFGGRTWLLEFQAGSRFFLAGEALLPWLGGLACLVIGVLLAGLLHSLRLTRERAQELARRMAVRSARNEARLQAIVRVIPDVLLVYNLEGRYLEILTQDTSRLSNSPEELLGHLTDEFLPKEVSDQVKRTVAQVLEEGQERTVDYTLDTPRGILRFAATVIPMPPEFADEPCVLWAARDITERESQETAMRQAQKMESLGLLAGGIAHDFNNLLTAIQGHLSLGRLDLAEHRDPSRHLDLVETSIRMAADLARRLLAYSGRTSMELATLDLTALLEEMTALLGLSHHKMVLLEVHLARGLPLIQADRVQLQQVVMNLITNASEAIGERPGTVTLRTGLSNLDQRTLEQRMPAQDLEPGAYVTLTVTDDGEGIAAEVLSRIFDPFFTTKREGRGLGLSTIRGILRTHRAGIEIASRVGEGTTVTLHFPVAEAPDPTPAGTALAQPALGDLGGTLLLAEDEPIIRDLASQMAERLGFQVLEAEDGLEAWDLYLEHEGSIQVVVLDLTMPRQGGAATYARIRARDPALPILLCSGYSREALPEALGADEPRAFLQKPFNFNQFSTALRDLMARVVP